VVRDIGLNNEKASEPSQRIDVEVVAGPFDVLNTCGACLVLAGETILQDRLPDLQFPRQYLDAVVSPLLQFLLNRRLDDAEFEPFVIQSGKSVKLEVVNINWALGDVVDLSLDRSNLLQSLPFLIAIVLDLLCFVHLV
jgi:hypothetical protein